MKLNVIPLLVLSFHLINGELDNYCCSPNDKLVSNEEEIFCATNGVLSSYNVSLYGKCSSFVALNRNSQPKYKVENDTLVVGDHVQNLVQIHKKDFCIADNQSSVVVLCTNEEDESDETKLAYCFVVSSIFLILTALVYTFISELRDLQGKIIISLCTSFAVSHILFAVMQLVPYVDMDLCAVKGFLVYFFSTASFFWMNSLSIQVFRSVRYPTTVQSGWREYIYYSIYSWGSTAVLTIIVIVANYVPGPHLVPGIGMNHCWFFSLKEQWMYQYSVLTIIIIINVCIFFYTSITLLRRTFRSSTITSLRYKFTMCLRLFIVLGVAWVFEIASASHGATHIIWTIMDIFNALQGLIIFIILVVLRRRAIKGMHKRGWMLCASHFVEKILAKADDEEENVIQHTEIALNDT